MTLPTLCLAAHCVWSNVRDRGESDRRTPRRIGYFPTEFQRQCEMSGQYRADFSLRKILAPVSRDTVRGKSRERFPVPADSVFHSIHTGRVFTFFTPADLELPRL
ncbi:hypothetical protein GCM10009754_03390 [Amycolatopsis minnesotensis]|uniref:Uncharacterized protein n=1 Tax=Amycolatopsis minnesotensis TaxID=337894 RepID=A0ABN2PZM9_9PSEU